MRRGSGSRAWRTALAAGLLIRPILIVPMAPSGPLGRSDLLPIALLAVFAGSALLAGGVLVGYRLVVALGIATAVAGIPLAAIGASVGLPMPWPLALAACNLALAAIGTRTWRALPAAADG
jgi:hypothetical protein